MEFQSSFRAVPEQFQSSLGTIPQCSFEADSKRFAGCSETVSEQFQSSYGAVLEQF